MEDTTSPSVGAEAEPQESKLTCATFQAYWVAGHQGPFVVKHVENCEQCLRILFGDGEVWKLSIEEEAEQELAAERRSMRRRFMVAAAAGLLVVAGGGWGLNRFFASRTTSTRVVVPKVQTFEAQYDAAFASGGAEAPRQSGRQGVVLHLRLDRQTEARGALCRRRQNGLCDVQPVVRKAALNALWRIDPVSLKPNLLADSASLSRRTNATTIASLNELIQVIMKS